LPHPGNILVTAPTPETSCDKIFATAGGVTAEEELVPLSLICSVANLKIGGLNDYTDRNSVHQQ
jgi:hypothetical protein